MTERLDQMEREKNELWWRIAENIAERLKITEMEAQRDAELAIEAWHAGRWSPTADMDDHLIRLLEEHQEICEEMLNEIDAVRESLIDSYGLRWATATRTARERS